MAFKKRGEVLDTRPYEIRVNRGFNRFVCAFDDFGRACEMADFWGVCVWENGRVIYEPAQKKGAVARDGEFSQTQAPSK